MTLIGFILARAVHFGACLLFFGAFAFDQFVVASIVPENRSAIAGYWSSRVRWFSLILLPLMLLSGLAWLALVSMTMSGLPWKQALRPETLTIVWNQTRFGTVWKVRLILWLAAAAVFALSFLFKSHKKFAGTQLVLGGLLLGSLAWSGHGQEGRPAYVHLLADVLHLWVAGFWPTGLLPLFLCLRKMRRTHEPARTDSTAALVRRFSALSLGSVALLAMTGWVNSWFLVGSFSNLLQQPYGKWLLVKITLFVSASAIGAVNLLRLKPRLMTQSHKTPVAQLQRNVGWELLLGMAIVVAVAILGMLPPAFH